MDARGLPVVDFVDAFKKFIPAIYQLAEARNLQPPNTPRPNTDDDNSWLAAKLLIKLVPLYCKRNKLCKIERLFAEGWVCLF